MFRWEYVLYVLIYLLYVWSTGIDDTNADTNMYLGMYIDVVLKVWGINNIMYYHYYYYYYYFYNIIIEE